MTIAVVAEKPAVARDLARVLGATARKDGYLEGGGYLVTWAIGHLVALAQPHQIDPAWKRWDLGSLPMLPAEFPLEVVPETKDQFAVVKKILRSRAVERVIAATDAGREGELIFRYIYEAAECKKPVSRLWISSLTEDAIRDGFAHLRSGRDFDRLADAARGRSRADWLVGLNLSRAYTLAGRDASGDLLSVGRVQTPTLAMLVEREKAIRDFVPEDYLEVVATFGAPARAEAPAARYDGTWFKGEKDEKTRRLPPDGEEAGRIVDRVTRPEAKARIDAVTQETKRIPPPLLYDLTELQRHANRLFGMSAQKTLEVAQQLYEEKKLISYPRTDSRHLTQDIAKTLPAIVRTIEGPYQGMLAPGTGQRALGRRFVDDSKVTDHHAILPTTVRAPEGLTNDQRRVYDLVCRRLLEAWHDDHVYGITRVLTVVESTEGGAPTKDPFESTGTAVEKVGWKVLDIGGGRKAPKASAQKKRPGDKGDDAPGEEEDDRELPPGLVKGLKPQVVGAEAIEKRTKPPPRLTDASLLTAMESAGKRLDEKELADAMKDVGLGTPATRASIIETLLRRDYIARAGKSFEATEKGIALVDAVHADVKSPAMTGEWEAKLAKIERGDYALGDFLHGIEEYVTEVVGKVRAGGPVTPRPAPAAAPSRREEPSDRPPAARAPVAERTAPSARGPQEILVSSARVAPLPDPTLRGREVMPEARHREPTPPNELRGLLKEAFGFDAFRRYQEAVCRAATEGRDVLLVMPTGAGKSLCYQLPGLARGGTTLVVSPLIALMEDQVQKLQALGFAADRVHSGRDRAASRQACARYLAGQLDFLFIAPERLRVPGFPEMLGKRKPVLVAIDEAHCISKWGHDFRPDYRMLGQRLPLLRPAPVIALTATATPEVQDDILEQLDLPGAMRFIHGFRRDNLGIELVETNPSERTDATATLLQDPGRRPAIVYAPTRKVAEDMAKGLGKRFSAAAYHAGMEPGARDRIQSAFLRGKLDVIVATIAFGMGIDKADVRTVVHAALPGSLEGYYQEIGRAGRDGLPSRAVLLHSFVDRKTHEFFHERDYPAEAVLERVFMALRKEPEPEEEVLRRAGVDADAFPKALEKLWIHGGAVREMSGDVGRGQRGWEKPYAAQRDHKLAELAAVGRFTQAHTCRMLYLVRHFGDQEDSGERCGMCDVCAPEAAVAGSVREPSQGEQAALARILGTLAREDMLATGRLFKDAFPDGAIDRRSFEHLLGGLVRAGLVEVREESFEKGDETITYQRATLTFEGRQEAASGAGRVRLPDSPRRGVTKRRKASPASSSGGGAKAFKGARGASPSAKKSSEASRRAFFAKKARKKGR